MQRFKNVSTEISLHVLAYNLKRMMSILSNEGLTIKAARAIQLAGITALAPNNHSIVLSTRL